MSENVRKRQKMSENVRTGGKWTCVIIIMHEGTEGGSTMDTRPAHRAGSAPGDGATPGGNDPGGWSGPQAGAPPETERPQRGSGPKRGNRPERGSSPGREQPREGVAPRREQPQRERPRTGVAPRGSGPRRARAPSEDTRPSVRATPGGNGHSVGTIPGDGATPVVARAQAREQPQRGRKSPPPPHQSTNTTTNRETGG